MALDKILIGERIREIRVEYFNESREAFAKRCNLKTRCVGQVERGEFLFSISTLDKIASATGIDTDYILYGKKDNDTLTIKRAVLNIINKADSNKLGMLYRCIATIDGYVSGEINNNTSKKSN